MRKIKTKMSYQNLKLSEKAPKEILVVVEISKGSDVKYELDKESGVLMVDRFLYTSMVYPFNYGFIPQTLAEDGDPVDVLVLSEKSILPQAVLKAKPIGVLIMEDEAGQDEKIVAVPLAKIDPVYSRYDNINQLEDSTKNKIKHFFEYYKTLEPGKWVKVKKWLNKNDAEKMILKAIKRFESNKNHKK
jgi:inorganic pyrophosphatase